MTQWADSLRHRLAHARWLPRGCHFGRGFFQKILDSIEVVEAPQDLDISPFLKILNDFPKTGPTKFIAGPKNS
ncbi:MAG: hypothetical protein DWQ01_17905 [Planctomycetota bacterium]|nr:MAG: hypothetical protein DWQ01_17905 [Planctomycetota bacterium]